MKRTRRLRLVATSVVTATAAMLPVDLVSLSAPAAKPEELGRRILQESGIDGGLCVHLGATDGPSARITAAANYVRSPWPTEGTWRL